jgi:prepilin-type N-terminal cleavage/methylation domain-containing protein
MNLNRTKRPRIRRVGFTLIEMLAVICILAILLGLVVGISRHIIERSAVNETITIQDIAMDVIMTYRDVQGALPGGNTLMQDLRSVPASNNKLANLPRDAWTGGTGLLDGWGRVMTYNPTGGFGGTPVLISRGPNGNLNDDDDIRSDKR